MSCASAPQFAVRRGCRAIRLGLSGPTIITQKPTGPSKDLAGWGSSQTSRSCHPVLPRGVSYLESDVFDPPRGAQVAKASDQAYQLALYFHGLPGCATR